MNINLKIFTSKNQYIKNNDKLYLKYFIIQDFHDAKMIISKMR